MKDVGGFAELHRLFAAVLVLLAFGGSVVRAAADAFPEDTNAIESLTPEQARKLAQEFPGVPVDVEFKGIGRTPLQKCLPLNGLKSLDAETAKALAEYKSHLLLNGLTTLSADAAKSLEEHKIGWLSLDGLTTLADEVAKALVKHNGVFLLNGLTTLSGETALTLTQHKGPLYLTGVTTLSDEAAKTLITRIGNLPGLTMLSAETAKALVAAGEKWNGALPNLTALDSPTVRDPRPSRPDHPSPLRAPAAQGGQLGRAGSWAEVHAAGS
jgi:hypothetical protein